MTTQQTEDISDSKKKEQQNLQALSKKSGISIETLQLIQRQRQVNEERQKIQEKHRAENQESEQVKSLCEVY